MLIDKILRWLSRRSARNQGKIAPCIQPRSQGLSSLPPLVIGTGTLVAAGHMTTQNLGGRKICHL